MRFEEVIWREQFLDKIARKHRLDPGEVEEVLHGRPLVRRQERGRRKGQDLYAVYGRTDAGRHIVVFLIRKAPGVAMPISARDMTPKERRSYDATSQRT
ncbi:MAG: BrnT family toxin [bacterium]|nr:BrnT family toxin [bacterium]